MDAIASQGLGPQAGLDSMGLVGQLPRTIIDDTPRESIDDCGWFLATIFL